MLDIEQFRACIIRPSLKIINLYSQEAEELLVAICAQESLGGTFLKQNGGSAMGIYQMEPSTHDSLWNHKLIEHSDNGSGLTSFGYQILKACNYISRPDAEMMIGNLYYATLMARAFWHFIDCPLPDHKNIGAIWTVYKKYWNTPKGRATQPEFIDNYLRFVHQK